MTRESQDRQDQYDAAIGSEMEARKRYMEARVKYGADSPEAKAAHEQIAQVGQLRDEMRQRHDDERAGRPSQD